LKVCSRADVEIDLAIARTDHNAIGGGFVFIDNPCALGAGLAFIGIDLELLRRADGPPLQLAAACTGGFAGACYASQGKE
jgi:hypothetical protein